MDEIVIVLDNYALQNSVWNEEILDDVVTHVEGMSLFFEL